MGRFRHPDGRRSQPRAGVYHACIREQYGNSSEKLAEFKLQPFRGRRPQSEKAKKAKAEKEKAKAETPPAAPEAVS